jgi:hypothetical protein
MREIWIPELLASFFTLIFLIRPLFKGLRPLEGIAWFPILSLGAVAALFPAYGFRPECLPFLAYHGVMALLSRPLLAGSRRGLRRRSSLFTVPAIAVLALVTGLALYFAPRDLPPRETRLVRMPGGDYSLRIFDAAGRSRGLIFLVPPGFGGIRAAGGVCAALADRGFTVIGYTPSGPRSPLETAARWSSFRDGTVLKKANDRGRALENKKRGEIEFILPYVRENLGTLAPEAAGGAVFLAGWGPGGSALYYLASEQAGPPGRSFAGGRAGAMFDGVLGLVAVESRLWSAWEPESPPVVETAPDGNPLRRALGIARRRLARLRPEKIKGPGEIQTPAIPLLCLVSDRAFGGEPARRDYAALFAGLRNARGPAALAALEGAGPLDYGGFPAEYPLYSALFPGLGRPPGGLFVRDSAGDTAALIARFCELAAGAADGTAAGVTNETGDNAAPAGEAPPPRRNLRLETRYWNLGDLRLY